MTGAIIGVDWGSTNVRAFRFDGAGAVIETRHSDRGAAALTKEDYEGVARDLVAGWRTGDGDRIVICGMAGSRDGWIEAPYLACPCDVSMLSKTLASPPSMLPVAIVPGLYTRDPRDNHDVMRGEETQILGALESGDAWFILPGTHSKWAEVQGAAIAQFQTHMTGEFFKLLRSHSVLSRSLDADAAHDVEAFARGAARGLEGEALTKTAFSVRAQSLFSKLTPAAAGSYLSGLLIGTEVADGLSCCGPRGLVVIAGKDLADLYRQALSLAGVSEVRVVDGETAAAKGLWRIAQDIAV